MFAVTPVQRHQIPWTFAILFSVAFAVFATVFSITHGIREAYPFLYFLPIILFIWQYPNRGVLFSLFISSIFLLLVYLFGNSDTNLIAISTAWFVMFVTVGVVTSSFAESLRTEEQKYRGIFENSQAGIFSFDLETGTLQEVNGKFARMLGSERDDLAGENLSRFLSEADGRNAFTRTLAEKTETSDIELFFHTRDGTVRQFMVSAFVSAENLAICSAIDITERKIAEQVIAKAREDLEQRVKERTEELIQANELLKAELQERKQFEVALQFANRKAKTISSITRHDILNHVSAITMCLSALRENVSDPATLTQLEQIRKITDLIKEQIRFTEDYQKIGEKPAQWLNVRRILEDALDGAGTGTIRVEKDLANLEVYADPLLGRVFANLVENSVHHGKSVSRIRFSHRIAGDELLVVCEDDGIGIPEHAKHRIFRREHYARTGYGLFLANDILASTGLTIRETGRPGEGARFEIRVPKGSFRISPGSS